MPIQEASGAQPDRQEGRPASRTSLARPDAVDVIAATLLDSLRSFLSNLHPTWTYKVGNPARRRPIDLPFGLKSLI